MLGGKGGATHEGEDKEVVGRRLTWQRVSPEVTQDVETIDLEFVKRRRVEGEVEHISFSVIISHRIVTICHLEGDPRVRMISFLGTSAN